MDTSEFEQVSHTLSQKVQGIALAKLGKHGYVSVRACSDAPDTFHELIEAFKEDQRGHATAFRVWGGASDKSIYSNVKTNYLARAWHDLLHVELFADFSDQSEIMLGSIQAATIGWTKLESDCIFYDIAGQTQHKMHWGEFPVDQRAFVIACLNLGRVDLSKRY